MDAKLRVLVSVRSTQYNKCCSESGFPSETVCPSRSCSNHQTACPSSVRRIPALTMWIANRFRRTKNGSTLNVNLGDSGMSCAGSASEYVSRTISHRDGSILSPLRYWSGELMTYTKSPNLNDQLTDGGPSVTPEPAPGVAGPRFGGAPGSPIPRIIRRRSPNWRLWRVMMG